MLCIPIPNPLPVNNKIISVESFQNTHETQMTITENISLHDLNLVKKKK